MAENREVVITGLGVVSPIGIGRDAFTHALEQKQSGVAAIQQFDVSALAVPFGAELKDFEPKLYVKPRKSLKVMSREIQAGVASAALAVEDAELPVDQLDPQRFGVVYGSPMLYSDMADLEDVYRHSLNDGEFDFAAYSEQFPKQMQPLWMLKYLPNMTASHIGIAHNARGANNSVVMGDISSLLAVMEAVSVIQRGVSDVMLAGGSGSRLSLTGVVYRGDSNLSHNPDPAKASRPFDVQRDGMIIGEGAGTLVLEDREHAERRGATIYGRVLASASTHAGSSTQDAMQHAIERTIAMCLDRSSVEQVGQINAHGLSDPKHDVWEARAIAATVGSDVPVTALKSYFGNVGASSGALELAASLYSPRAVTPTLNLEQLDPECNINVSSEPLLPRGSTVLKLGQNATGQAAAILVDMEPRG